MPSLSNVKMYYGSCHSLKKNWVQKCFCSKREECFKNPLFPMNITNLELIIKKSINDLKYSCKSKLLYYENPRMPLGHSFLLE
jgi:hypothetical protein